MWLVISLVVTAKPYLVVYVKFYTHTHTHLMKGNLI